MGCANSTHDMHDPTTIAPGQATWHQQVVIDGLRQRQATTLDRTLDLSGRGLNKTSSARIVASVIAADNRVRELRLHNNSFDAECALVIADALQQNDTITSLSLASNRLGGPGVAKLMEGLCKRTGHLSSLCLDANNIGAGGAKRVAALVENFPALCTLRCAPIV